MLPTNRLIVLLAAASPLWFLAAVLPGAWVVPLVYLLVLLLLSFWGYSHIPGPRHFSIKRILPSRFSLGSEQSIVLSITNHSGQKILMEVRDDLPGSLKLLSRFEPFLLNPGSTVEVGCRVKPVKRGYLHLRHVHCRVQQQGFELVRRQFSVEVESQGKVYPRFLGVDKYDLLASIDRREEGLKTSRLGQGSDFESLRPYLPGEDLRSIDWKISAKRDALISRNLQVEKGRQLTILIDAGRFMLDRIGDRSRFEHALDAAVMLSYVAQKKGDTVSVACFSNRIESFLPPVKGQLIMPRVLETLFDVHPRNIESDYWHVFARVLSRLKKRSLIVLISEVLDRAGSAGLVNNLVHSVRKHLVLCVVLAEEKVYTAADQAPSNLRQSYLKAAAGHVILERYMALDDMRSKGIMVLETSPEHFSIQLVRKYLEIRKTDLL
jgi:uncharacterized protein (DUF58 family)